MTLDPYRLDRDQLPQLLIVEDEVKWQEIIGEEADDAGVAYEVASDLQSALTAIERRRFDAAVVDVALTDPSTSSGEGEIVTEAFHALSEGTAVLVASAHASSERASRIALLFGTPLLSKRGGLSGVSATLGAMVESGRAKRPKPSGSQAQAVMRGSMDGVMWEDVLLRRWNGATGDVTTRNRFVAELVTPLWPLVASNSRPGMTISNDLIVGDFWSRGIGSAVRIALGNVDAGSTGDGLVQKHWNTTSGYVWALPDQPRSDYASALPILGKGGRDWLSNFF